MFQVVVSTHTNPYTCGVARFSRSLAEEIGVPHISLDEYMNRSGFGKCLLSLKIEETPNSACVALGRMIREKAARYSYFMHDFSDSEPQNILVEHAQKVFANSAELASLIRPRRPDVVEVYSPGARVRQRLSIPDLRLLTAGMAHKIRAEHYNSLAKLMEGETRSIRLEVTSSIHEGNRFDETFFSVAGEIASVFRRDVHFCGFLSDEELSERLHSVDAYVAFFPHGVRENNTTVMSAMSHGCPVITNLDEWSPKWLRHGETILDVSRLVRIPEQSELRSVGEAGMNVARQFSFERLVQILM